MTRYKAAPRYVPGKGWLPAKEPMTSEARARLDARADVERWHRQWMKLWARIGVEHYRPAARAYLAQHLHLGAVTPGDAMYQLSSYGEIALIDYKLRFPQARGEHAIVGRAVPTEGLNAWERRDAMGLADYHCRYCGKRLRRLRKGYQWWGQEPDYLHARWCALESLAGVRVPVPPGHTPACEDPETLRLAIDQLAAVVRAVVLAWANDVVDPTMLRYSNLEMS